VAGEGLGLSAVGKNSGVSLTVTLIVLISLAVLLLGTLAFVMTRPKELRPHRPSRRRFVFWRRAGHGRTRGGGAV